MSLIFSKRNRFWKELTFSFRGWRLEILLRNKNHRKRHRRWLQVYLFNYNYSEEAKSMDPKPIDAKTCHSCGQDMAGRGCK